MPKFDYTEYVQEEFGPLVGRTITGVRLMTEGEMNMLGWYEGGGSVPIVIALDNKMLVIPSQDPEGNGPGHLFIEEAE
jgi:hypothetical protein